MKRYSFLVVLAGLVIFSCNNDPGFSNIPEISYIDIQPKEPRQFRDSLLLTLRFTDGDGNLGDDDTQVKNLVLKDKRDWLTEEQATLYFNIPNLTPDTKNPAIQGTITIEIPPTAIRPGLEFEETFFDVYVLDRSDNESNTVSTEPIKIVK